MVVVDMRGVGQRVAEGEYPVVLTEAYEKAATGNRDGDLVTVKATIKGSDSDWEGRILFKTFFIGKGMDNSGTLYHLQKTLMAFGADDEEVTSPTMDPVKVARSLYGNRAKATVVHNCDKEDMSKVYVNADFAPDDF